MNHRILLVEDDENFGIVLRDFLNMNGYEVDLCRDGEEGRRQFEAAGYDAVILDVMMPKVDGFSLGRYIRKSNEEIPLIYLTAKTMKEDMVEGFEVGADDYITKPFDSQLLLLRLKAVLRRNGSGADMTQTKYEIGQAVFDYNLRLLKLPEKEFRLSPKEAELLRLLCAHMNGVLSRSEALTEIWEANNYFTGRSMDVYVTKLRKYLQDIPQVAIENIHGKGFMLMAPKSAEATPDQVG